MVQGVAFSPRDDMVWVGGGNGSLVVWKAHPATGRFLTYYFRITTVIYSFSFF